MVLIQRPSHGTYTIEVVGADVPVGNPLAQGYALVATGPVQSTVPIDRRCLYLILLILALLVLALGIGRFLQSAKR